MKPSPGKVGPSLVRRGILCGSRWGMYDMVFRDVAVLPKMSSVYHWMEGRDALTSDME